MIDTRAMLWGDQSMGQQVVGWEEESLRDLAKVLLDRPRQVSRDNYTMWDLCQYQVHSEKVRCTWG